MVRLTLIARVQDGLPLAEGLDSEKDAEIDSYKTQAKVCSCRYALCCFGHKRGAMKASTPPLQSLLKKFSQQPSQQAARLSVESGRYTFHYLIDSGVCYLTLTEKGYPKKLAFQYLEELTNEFTRLYGPQVHTVNRPYAFIKFGKSAARDLPSGQPGAQAASYDAHGLCAWRVGAGSWWSRYGLRLGAGATAPEYCATCEEACRALLVAEGLSSASVIVKTGTSRLRIGLPLMGS